MSDIGSFYQIAASDVAAFEGKTTLADFYQALGVWGDGDPHLHLSSFISKVLEPSFRDLGGDLGTFFKGDLSAFPETGGDPAVVVHRPERVETILAELKSSTARDGIERHFDNFPNLRTDLSELEVLMEFYGTAVDKKAAVVILWSGG